MKPLLSALSSPSRGPRAGLESLRAWYAAGWMTIESDRWAHDAYGVARGLELAPETDEIVRLAVER